MNASPSAASIFDHLQAKEVYPPERMEEYLTSGYPVLDLMEVTSDVVNGSFQVPGGSSLLTDGLHVWRVDLPYYVRAYEIDLPASFLTFTQELDYRVPSVQHEVLVSVSVSVRDWLGFRVDKGAAPRRPSE
ncbi:hypothetical protein [Streptomyces lavendulocolor]|uniref:hypothetical protein n=1 Tax=Streptomyces lavendulocolor TaxID=67316 RepID=UPI0033F08E76